MSRMEDFVASVTGVQPNKVESYTTTKATSEVDLFVQYLIEELGEPNLTKYAGQAIIPGLRLIIQEAYRRTKERR